MASWGYLATPNSQAYTIKYPLAYTTKVSVMYSRRWTTADVGNGGSNNRAYGIGAVGLTNFGVWGSFGGAVGVLWNAMGY